MNTYTKRQKGHLAYEQYKAIVFRTQKLEKDCNKNRLSLRVKGWGRFSEVGRVLCKKMKKPQEEEDSPEWAVRTGWNIVCKDPETEVWLGR